MIPASNLRLAIPPPRSSGWEDSTRNAGMMRRERDAGTGAPAGARGARMENGGGGKRGPEMAPAAGLEPATRRLTAACSTN